MGRHRLIHDYFEVDLALVWEVVQLWIRSAVQNPASAAGAWTGVS
ncbi:MAG: HepT-like ribonuclease domain-containing protein [Wenzhouxiangella sp.]